MSGVIADLEHTFGVPLFDRSHAGVEPTVYGQALLRRGLAAFDELKLGLRDIEFLANPARGEVRIGCPDFDRRRDPGPAGAEILCRDYPGITLTIASVPKPTLDVPELRARELDVVLSRLSKPRADDPLRAAISTSRSCSTTRWSSRPAPTAAGRAGASSRWPTCTMPPGSERRAQTLTAMLIEQAFRADDLPVPTMRVVSFSVQLRAHLLATGDYVCPMPKSMLRLNPECKGLKELPIRLPNANFPVAIVTLKARTLPAAAALFLDRLRAHVASLA